ncbi:MAG: hypothetical protein MK212_18875 [Saprospiraceae bacterium]|nr:hypothetical protein [Saprospiraceae bacterium]
MNQDTIYFDIALSQLGDYLTTEIYINGIDLRVILTNIEVKQIHANDANSLRLAGAYEGVSPFIAFHLKNHFYKNSINEYMYDDCFYTIYEYAYSGVPEDHTLSCRIDFVKNKVIWSEFKNFSKICPEGFDYEGLTFTFDRRAYMNAIDNVKLNRIKSLYV